MELLHAFFQKIQLLHAFFQKIPMAALFLSVAIGYWVGKFKIGNFQLGGMAGTLLAAVVIGQVGVPVDAEVKSIMFALFIYATGYVSGPQFFASLNRKTLSQLHLALVSAITVFAFIFIVVKVMGLDKGTAAGLLAGATTDVWGWPPIRSKCWRPTSGLPTPLPTCSAC
jgi:AspT/YidE/YbjL antiporter-like protein